jgi:hypothetical protein
MSARKRIVRPSVCGALDECEDARAARRKLEQFDAVDGGELFAERGGRSVLAVGELGKLVQLATQRDNVAVICERDERFEVRGAGRRGAERAELGVGGVAELAHCCC